MGRKYICVHVYMYIRRAKTRRRTAGIKPIERQASDLAGALRVPAIGQLRPSGRQELGILGKYIYTRL